LAQAARGVWCSRWHLDNGQTSFDLVMRDTAHVERFMAEATSSPTDNEWPDAPKVCATLPDDDDDGAPLPPPAEFGFAIERLASAMRGDA
jgi:hypothetical protein